MLIRYSNELPEKVKEAIAGIAKSLHDLPTSFGGHYKQYLYHIKHTESGQTEHFRYVYPDINDYLTISMTTLESVGSYVVCLIIHPAGTYLFIDTEVEGIDDQEVFTNPYLRSAWDGILYNHLPRDIPYAPRGRATGGNRAATGFMSDFHRCIDEDYGIEYNWIWGEWRVGGAEWCDTIVEAAANYLVSTNSRAIAILAAREYTTINTDELP